MRWWSHFTSFYVGLLITSVHSGAHYSQPSLVSISRVNPGPRVVLKLVMSGLMDRTKGNILDYLFGGGGGGKQLENNININLGAQPLLGRPGALPPISGLNSLLGGLGGGGLLGGGEDAYTREMLSLSGLGSVPSSMLALLKQMTRDRKLDKGQKKQLLDLASSLVKAQPVRRFRTCPFIVT